MNALIVLIKTVYYVIKYIVIMAVITAVFSGVGVGLCNMFMN